MLGPSDLFSYSLEIYRDGTSNTSSAFLYSGAYLSKLSLNLKPNQELRCVATWIAASLQYIAKQSAVSFPSSAMAGAPFAFDTCSIQLGGAAITRFDEINIELDNQLEAVNTLDGNTAVARIVRTGPQLVRVGGVIEFDDFTDFDAFKNQTEQRLVIALSRPTSYSLVMGVPEMVFTEVPVGMSDRGRVTTSFNANGRKPVGVNTPAFFAMLTLVSSLKLA